MLERDLPRTGDATLAAKRPGRAATRSALDPTGREQPPQAAGRELRTQHGRCGGAALPVAEPVRNELRRRRREITELQWQLARFISHHPGGGNLAA